MDRAVGLAQCTKQFGRGRHCIGQFFGVPDSITAPDGTPVPTPVWFALDDGRLVEQGTPDEILENPREDYTKRLMAAAFA